MKGRSYTSSGGKYKYGFNGMEYDEEAEDYTTMYRLYDPGIGRWFSPDPLVYDDETPYSFVSNDPINMVDPLGLEGGTGKVTESKGTFVEVCNDLGESDHEFVGTWENITIVQKVDPPLVVNQDPVAPTQLTGLNPDNSAWDKAGNIIGDILNEALDRGINAFKNAGQSAHGFMNAYGSNMVIFGIERHINYYESYDPYFYHAQILADGVCIVQAGVEVVGGGLGGVGRSCL